ncbi:hypothetical protein ACAW74_24165 [Fibrella sp. WM1]|uniref:hypothetical protein n=1 Tax=Fibrella musci TaxID=3242485 RepID=UPI003522B714
MSRLLIVLLFAGASALTGCATLTQSQVEAVNQFATLTGKGVDYPEKVLNEVLDSQYKRRVLNASQNVGATDPLTYKAIADLHSEKLRSLDTARRFKASMAAISAYATALQRLSSPDFATTAGTSADALGESVDKVAAFIPGVSGVGAALSGTLKALSGRYISGKQTKAIQRFVAEGDALVAALCQSNETYFQNNVSVFIDGIELVNTRNVDGLLRSIPTGAAVERYQMAVNVSALVAQQQQLKQLNKQTVLAFRQVRLAHAELKQSLMAKQTLASLGKQLLGLYNAVQDLQTTYKEVKL